MQLALAEPVSRLEVILSCPTLPLILAPTIFLSRSGHAIGLRELVAAIGLNTAFACMVSLLSASVLSAVAKKNKTANMNLKIPRNARV